MSEFDPQTYRELLASEQLDPDPLERLIATMQLGFSALASMVASAAAGEEVQIPPSAFDPYAKKDRSERSQEIRGDVIHCGPNQARDLVFGMIGLI